MKNLQKILINLFVLIVMLLPVMGLAQTTPPTKGLVPCTEGKLCDFKMLMLMIDNIVKFIVLKLAMPIAAIMFFYAGLLLVTSGGESGEARGKAKSIFLNTALGLIIVLAAWLIISTILAILGFEGAWIGL